MTAPPEDDVAPEITLSTKSKRHEERRIGFAITTEDEDGKIITDRFVFIAPKLSVAMRMSMLPETTDDTTWKLGVALIQLMGTLLQYVEASPPDKNDRPTGRELLLARPDDPDDDLDIMELSPVFRQLQAAVFGTATPTLSPRASSAKRRSTGRGSGAASRGRQVKTSG